MSRAFLALAALFTSCAAAPNTLSLRVTGDLSQKDVREITATVHAATQQPLLDIIVQTPDRVAVGVGSDQNLTGASFWLKRAGTTWKVVSKGTWIH